MIAYLGVGYILDSAASEFQCVFRSRRWWVLSCKDAPRPRIFGVSFASTGTVIETWKLESTSPCFSYSELVWIPRLDCKGWIPAGWALAYSGPYTDDGILKNGFLGSLTYGASM